MGQKINSNAMRMGISKTWKSRWFKTGDDYITSLHEDKKLREHVEKVLSSAGVDRVEISRTAGKTEVNVYVAKPGVAIGRGGAGVEVLTAQLKKLVGSPVELKVSEVKKPDLSASIIAAEIVSGLLRRMPPKLLAMNAIEKAKAAGAKGIRIWIGGRIGGASQARVIKHSDGPVPLHSLKANIDYAKDVAATHDLGKFGIKVWVFRPEAAGEEEQR